MCDKLMRVNDATRIVRDYFSPIGENPNQFELSLGAASRELTDFTEFQKLAIYRAMEQCVVNMSRRMHRNALFQGRTAKRHGKGSYLAKRAGCETYDFEKVEADRETKA